MASSGTPHYELFDQEKDIMIYGIKIEELFAEGFEINMHTLETVHQMIPDVLEKCGNSSLEKKQ